MKSIEERVKELFGEHVHIAISRDDMEDALRELAADLNAEKEKELAELRADRDAWKQSEAECERQFNEQTALLDEVKEVLTYFIGAAKPDFKCTSEVCRNHAAAHNLLTRLGGSHE